MRRKRLARLVRKLRVMRKSLPKRDQLLLRIGAAKKEAGRAFGFVKLQIPQKDEAVTRESFSFHSPGNVGCPWSRAYQILASVMEIEPCLMEYGSFCTLGVGAKEDGGPENPLKGSHQVSVLGTALLQAERVEHLRAAPKCDPLPLLPNGESSKEDGNKAILPPR